MNVYKIILLTTLGTMAFCFLFCSIVGNIYQREQEEVFKEKIDTVEKKFSEWDIFTMALIWQESEGNDSAKNGDNWGCLQLRPIYVEEVNRLAGTSFVHEDALNRRKSMLIFELMNAHKNPNRNIDNAIKLHNPNAPISYSKSIKQKMKILKSIL